MANDVGSVSILPVRQVRLSSLIKLKAAEEKVTPEVALDGMVEKFRKTAYTDATLASAVELTGAVRIAPEDEKLMADTFKRHGIHSLQGAAAMISGAILSEVLDSPELANVLRTEAPTPGEDIIPPHAFNVRDRLDVLAARGQTLDDAMDAVKKEMSDEKTAGAVVNLASILRVSDDDQQYIADAAKKHGITDDAEIKTVVAYMSASLFAAEMKDLGRS